MEKSCIRMIANLTDLNNIEVLLSKNYYNGLSPKFYLRDLHLNTLDEIVIDAKNEDKDYVHYYFTNVNVDLAHNYQIVDNYGLAETLQYIQLVKKDHFDDNFYYDGNDLGVHYHKNYTEFKIWTPTALGVKVEVYSHKSDKSLSFKMERHDQGVFYARIEGDYEGYRYIFLVRHHDSYIRTLDPYAYASSPNGESSVIVNLEKCQKNLNRDYLKPMDAKTDAVIYEVSVRDFTMHESIQSQHKGQFLGMIESGLTSKNNHPIGFDYLVNMGYTHIQLLPIYDFATVDEMHPQTLYNWGYDPMQYGVTEGSYVTDPLDGYKRIKELQDLVAQFHKHGLRIVMDVVYNHVFDVNAHSFERTVPGYFFRKDENGNLSNGSWCGNDLNTKAKMCRKYIVDISKRWQTLYGIDGFRFDLMGIIDIETLNMVYDECSKKDDDFLVYGEGWNMSTALPQEERSCQENHKKLLNIGFFNDFYRDILKGGSSDDCLAYQGYFTGNMFNCKTAGECMQNIYRYSYVDQSINYLECHDNATLADKISKSNFEENYETRKKRQYMLNIALLLSQGIPFIHAGQEFYISKNGLGNTYNSPDSINAIDWNLVDDNYNDLKMIKKIIQLRKQNKAFKYETIQDVKEHVSVESLNNEVLIYKTTQDQGEYKEFIVYFNPSHQEYDIGQHDQYEVLYKENEDIQYIHSLSLIIFGLKR